MDENIIYFLHKITGLHNQIIFAALKTEYGFVWKLGILNPNLNRNVQLCLCNWNTNEY